MRERFERWKSKRGLGKRWAIGAIATPVFLGMMWWLGSLGDRGLQPDGDRRARNESATPTRQTRETLTSRIGTIATVAGSVFLLVNFRTAKRNTETVNLSGADLSGADLSGADLSGADLNCAVLSGADLSDADLSGADLSGADLTGADLGGADLSDADLSGADLSGADLTGADLNRAGLRYANLSSAELGYANLCEADLRHANLCGADLKCTFLRGANFSDANLSSALLFFINSRGVLNLEPLQLAAKPSPFLCNVALPAYAHQLDLDPNRDCSRIPQLLSDRYDISLEEARGIVEEARQHRWD